ncbi:MAG: hypothetical protein F6K10_28680 [Moorea sp. SIO2B7]|nr:hypothetical protein [Moorena sp. SIO2B7]
MFRDFKSGGYHLQKTLASGKRLNALILLVTLAQSSFIMAGEKIKQQRVAKYVGRVKEKRRKNRRHSIFYCNRSGGVRLGRTSR